MANLRLRSLLFAAVVVGIIIVTHFILDNYLPEFWLVTFLILSILAAFLFIVLPIINPVEMLKKEIQQREEKVKTLAEGISALQNKALANEKKYRERVEDAVDAIYEIDATGFYIYVNPGSEKLTGYSQPELLKMQSSYLITDEYKNSVADFYKNQIINKIEKTYHEFPIRTKSGKRVWVGQTTRMIFAGGKVEKVHNVARDISEIHESREKLEKSETRFKLMAENSSVGIHEMNAQAEVVYMNKQWSEISGVPEFSTNEQRMNAIHKEDLERTMQAWGKAFKEKKKISLEFRFIHPVRGIVWVISTTSPIFDDKGDLQGFIGTLTDITETKETYLKLAKSEETYRLISSNAKDLITLYKNDDNATRTFISPSAKNILGYEPEELIGKSPFDIILPEDAERMKQSTHVETLKGKSANMEYRVRRKDGTIIWMETNSNPYFNDKGEMIGFQTSAREITRRKEIELKLEERERIYRLLSENTHDLIAIHDAEGRYTFVSSSFKSVLGYELQELIGLSAYEIIHPGDHERLREQAHQPALQGTSLSGVEYRIRKKDQTYIWVETYTQPIVDENNIVTSIQTSSRDVSQRKSYELALKQAITKAEEASNAKSQFLSMMSHEIRTPMNAVIGLTNFMIEDNPPDHHLENLKLLRYSGENLLSIINDILDFNKIEAGKIDLEEIPFDLVELLENLIKMMQSKASAKQLSLLLQMNYDLPKYVKGDPVRINQVLVNLLGNAIKFTHEGSVELQISLEGKSGDLNKILFAVSDTGIGIESDKQEIIFENFSQANKAITRKFGGTGLGLAISKKLVNLMGGELKVESQSGKGSVFYFSLELKSSAEIPRSRVTPHVPVATKTDVIKVLVVEDNPVNQVVVNNYLSKWGLTAEFANNGKEALQKLSARTYQLVLMDLQMPEMDGYEATRRIRANDDSYFKEIPIIALTASAMTDHLEDIKKAGFDEVVTKPFKPAELHEKIFSKLPQTSSFSMNTIQDDDVKSRNLKKLMADNLREVIRAIEEDDLESFQSRIHKSKTTLALINNKELSDLIEKTDNSFSESNKKALISICQKQISTLNA
ncbi:MAG: PAS domain S-box protein [Cyclobacteriaceae bacterium]|nr:PAS domain S-box protein [Cyclobacteriaceae bacterium]